MRRARLRPSTALAAALGLSACSLGAKAHAQVIEVGADGVATVLSGPAVTTREGVSPLTARPAPTADAVSQEIALAAARHGIDARLVRAVAAQESGLRQAARSPRGAVGVMQLMPATARGLGVDPADLAGNVEGGAAYLAQMVGRFGGDLRLALAAYNAGPGSVDRHGGVPPFAETRAYVRAVLSRLAASAVPDASVPPLAALRVAP